MKFYCILLATLLLSVLAAKKKYNLVQHKKPPPVKLNTDNLPTLPEILEGLQLSQYLPGLVKMGVTETRLLLRLSPMDYRLMEIEWEGVTKDEITKLKDAVAALVIAATVTEEVPKIDLSERNKLGYGRVYLEDSVESYEYSLASFGKPPPIGKQQIVALPSVLGCREEYSSLDTDVDYSGKTLVVQRGNCTFLSKAQHAKALNASGLIIVNTEDRLESPSSGWGVDKNVSIAMVDALKDLYIIGMSNTTWAKINKALEFHGSGATFVSVVPLKCALGKTCSPVVDEERALQAEVTWGHMRSKNAVTGEVRSFEFLTSNFGCHLPSEGHTVNVVLSDSPHACDPLVPSDKYKNAAVVVSRGKCRFDVKAFNVQESGARLMIIVDTEDKALQRVGGMTPEVGYVGIPSVIVTAPTGEYFRSVLQSGEDSGANDGTLSIDFSLGRDNKVSEMWIDLSMTELAEDMHARQVQLEGLAQKYSQQGGGSIEIVPWLHRRIDEITYAQKKSIDTDEL